MWVCHCVKALQHWSALIALGGGAAGLCQGDYVSVSFLGALMQNIPYLYIWFLFSIGFAVPVTMDEAKFPKEAYKSIAR